MSSINNINSISGIDDGSGPIISGITTFTKNIKLPIGTSDQRVGIESGSIRYNSQIRRIEFYNGTVWQATDILDRMTSHRGLFGGGTLAPTANRSVIEYIAIETTGNATTFGDLTVGRVHFAACSSSTRGVFGGGFGPSNVMDYITIATTGDAIDFGDLTLARRGPAACSSSTRGVFGGGQTTNTIDYITIATTGDATDFGDLTVARYALAACSSSTRGVFGGGSGTPTVTNTIDYITIATTGNATDFGDLTVVRYALASCSSSTRGVFGGGYIETPVSTYYNTIDYITIATTGNATDFGDLTVVRSNLAACSSSTRGVFGGGFFPGPVLYNTLDYITIATTGNATNFGDLTSARQGLAACSSDHGGLS